MIFIFIACWISLATISVDSASALEPFFRSDYNYDGRQTAFYKVHETPRTWLQARATCVAEGGTLAYPETQAEAELLVRLAKLQPHKNLPVWLGAHDLFAESIFVNNEGVPIEQLWANWNEGEPNDANDKEDCVMLSSDGKLNDGPCDSRFPSICKKTRTSLTSNPVCETADLEYVPNEDQSRCYKVHRTSKLWPEAFSICYAEQAYPVIINDENEASFLVELIRNYSIPQNFIGVGFHDIFSEGEYTSIKGISLQKEGYSKWAAGQPDNAGNKENCGSITREALLNDIDCSFTRMPFICEKEIGDSNVVDLFSRFQDSTPVL